MRTQRRMGYLQLPASTTSNPLYQRMLQVEDLSSLQQWGTDLRGICQGDFLAHSGRQSEVPFPIMAAIPDSHPDMAASSEPLLKMADSPEPHHKMAVSSEPLLKMAVTPESRPIMAATPESRFFMATLPEPTPVVPSPVALKDPTQVVLCSVVSRGDINHTSQMMVMLGALVKGILVKYWIFCCCFMFFFVSFSDKVAVFKILYICLFLFCVVLYEVHYEVWRSLLKHFWAVVVGYSMLVLILIYVYQFKSVCNLFQQILGIPEERLRDIGLEQFDTIELFAQILLPAFFLLACILQLRYFNCDFLSLTNLQTVLTRNRIN
ncbi:hypothetical protein cypCar_00028810, partial [Cyprinus carpio]